MEYVEGHSLAEVLKGEPIAPRDIVDIATQVADALQAAHAGGIVHRDVKPADLMITTGSVVKVVDFGLAKVGPGSGEADGGETRAVHDTEPGLVMGVAYMSPEQAVGGPLDHRTDLFSLGVVL